MRENRPSGFDEREVETEHGEAKAARQNRLPVCYFGRMV